jgi:hypothetical protein
VAAHGHPGWAARCQHEGGVHLETRA